jgi:hypothetical protein
VSVCSRTEYTSKNWQHSRKKRQNIVSKKLDPETPLPTCMDAQQRINTAKSSAYIDQIASLHTLDHGYTALALWLR